MEADRNSIRNRAAAIAKTSSLGQTRRRYASMLNECFSDLPGLRVTTPPDHIRHSYYKHYAFVRPETLRAGWTRDRVIEEVVSRGVPCFSGSCSEIYLEKAFPPEWRPKERLPVARELGETSLMFLVHPTLTPEHVAATCDVVKQVIQEATAVAPRAFAASAS